MSRVLNPFFGVDFWMILDGNSGVAAVATQESINGQDGDEGVGMLVLSFYLGPLSIIYIWMCIPLSGL